MGVNIKNPKIEAAIRELAAARGIGLNEAIGDAVERDLKRFSQARQREIERKMAAIREITDGIAARRGPDAPTWAQLEDELYDEHGLPI